MHKYQSSLLFFLLAGLLFLLLGSCSPTKKLRKSLQANIETSPVFSKSFTGFALYDPARQKWLASQWADHYFTPASNTKIWTLYASLNLLGDQLPVLQYNVRQDSLIFWGTGHPGFLHPDLPVDSTAFQFLKNWSGPVFFSSQNYADQRYGSGWMWDDFPYAFQAEKSPFPIYGNLVSFISNGKSKPEAQPRYFDQHLQYVPGGSWVQRSESSNTFTYNGGRQEGRSRRIPFHYSDSLLVRLLSDTLDRPVFLFDAPLLPDSSSHTLFSSQPADSLYQLMMQQSDNFIAEQLLLTCASKINNKINTKSAIQFTKDSLSPATAPIIWEDGSGLSRYNMFTPRSMVQVLEKLWTTVERERLLHLFPAGGESGTIAGNYPGINGPFIFAKTGTLRHNHCLSGYLRTRSGRWLIFSFMHNHFPSSSRPLKVEMERVLAWVWGEL